MIIRERSQFTFWICVLDVFLYACQLLAQQFIQWNPRPQQVVLFYFGQLYPLYRQHWRLLLSLEQHRNEYHLLFSIAAKCHFFSFVESMMGTRKIIIIYIVSGFSGSLFQSITSKQAGVGGSFHIAIIGLALLLQTKLLKQQAQNHRFIFDYHATEDVGIIMLKMVFVFGIAMILSIKEPQILFNGCVMFLVQSLLLGHYFSKSDENQVQFVTNVKKRDYSALILVALIIGIQLYII